MFRGSLQTSPQVLKKSTVNDLNKLNFLCSYKSKVNGYETWSSHFEGTLPNWAPILLTLLQQDIKFLE